jgi:hypothetical protein
VDATADRPVDASVVADGPVDAPRDLPAPDGPPDAGPDLVADRPPDGPVDTRIFPDVMPAELVLTPAAHDFLAVPVGMMGARTFTLENHGQLGSGTPSVSVTGAVDDNFRVSSNGCETSIEAHESCTIEVQFSPSTAGAQSALLEVEASPGGRVSAQLSGSATAAASAAP